MDGSRQPETSDEVVNTYELRCQHATIMMGRVQERGEKATYMIFCSP
ncbi:MAG: hypothetical protein H0X57_07435 [Rubrobacter sp.]|nr:hypothetical protein [Rubrobacter sp.]MDQ3376977.1 hypothetical protein [Actinomycetota bacterium]